MIVFINEAALKRVEEAVAAALKEQHNDRH